jgi:tyrosine-protein kinase
METNGSPYDRVSGARPADYFRVARERKWVILGTVVLAVALAMLFSLLQTPLYRATSDVVRQTATLDQTLFGTSVFESQDTDRQLQTAARLVQLKAVAQMVKDELQSSRSVESLLGTVTVETSSDTDLIHISAESPDPAEAAAVANSFARQFIEYRKQANKSILASAAEEVLAKLAGMTPEELASESGATLAQRHEELVILQAMQTGGFELVQEASVPDSTVSPRPFRNAGFALIGGLILGILLAFLLDSVDRRIKSEEQMEREFGLPVLASVPKVGRRWRAKRNGRAKDIIGFTEADSPFLEAYRTLRSNLRFYQMERPARTLLITSGLAQEGKTVTAINLALSLALSGARVTLLETDLRRPMIDQYLDLDNEVGVSTVLAGTSTFRDSLQVAHVPSFATDARFAATAQTAGATMQRALLCMTSGPLPPNPAELLNSARMKELVETAAEHSEYVLIDTPPLLLVSDALNLAGHADGVIVAAKMKGTTLDEARDVRTALERSGCRVLGIVANGVGKRRGSYYRAHYKGYRTSSKSA